MTETMYLVTTGYELQGKGGKGTVALRDAVSGAVATVTEDDSLGINDVCLWRRCAPESKALLYTTETPNGRVLGTHCTFPKEASSQGYEVGYWSEVQEVDIRFEVNVSNIWGDQTEIL